MINGLHYVPDYLTSDDATSLVAAIDAQPWRDDLKRRVQHYGYRYDYRSRSVTPEMHLGAIPAWVLPLATRLHADGYFSAIPDQVIVNDYLPGQGIAPHVDCEPCFGDVIASLSLGSACVMRFSHLDSDRVEDLPLDPGSLLVLSGEARYAWKHGIPARKSDVVDGHRRARGRRVSVTFRTVIVE
jgi:alkylated DNA repair dioxygenase AlkB